MPEKLDYEQMVKDQAKEISALTREKRELEHKIRGYKGLSARGNPVAKQEPLEDRGQEQRESVKDLPEPHFVGPWQKYCPSCGGANPDFKDETECVDCHMHLGSAEVAQTLKACPNCGGTKAKKIGK